jgi:hypothetical protein
MSRPSLTTFPQAADLNGMIDTLDATVRAMSECHVCPGWSLAIPAIDMVGMHYSLAGSLFLELFVLLDFP